LGAGDLGWVGGGVVTHCFRGVAIGINPLRYTLCGVQQTPTNTAPTTNQPPGRDAPPGSSGAVLQALGLRLATAICGYVGYLSKAMKRGGPPARIMLAMQQREGEGEGGETLPSLLEVLQVCHGFRRLRCGLR